MQPITLVYKLKDCSSMAYSRYPECINSTFKATGPWPKMLLKIHASFASVLFSACVSGYFIAPIGGVCYFRFTGYNAHTTASIVLKLVKNEDPIVHGS